MRPLPFRLKIALLSALISGLVLTAFGAAAWFLIHRQKVESVDTEIRSLGARHPGWLANRGNFDRFNNSLEFIFGAEHKGQVLLLVKDAGGQQVFVSPGWPQELSPGGIDCSLADDPEVPVQTVSTSSSASRGPPWAGGAGGRGGQGRGLGAGRAGNPVLFTKLPRFFTAEAGASAWRIGVMGNDELRVVVGLNFDAVQAELNRTRNIFLGALPIALLLVGGGGWLVAGRALRPLQVISRTAERMTARGLDQRIPLSNEDPEIARLVRVLNSMMDRLEASFHQATRFSADASHELKTPLAVMQAELETALQETAPGSAAQQVFNNLLEEIQRLKNITRSLLLLSQADAGQLKLTLEITDLSAEVETILDDARVLAADAGLNFEPQVQAGMRVMADRGLLRMALLNLISNAVKYSEAKGTVRVTLAAEGKDALLTLCNGGPGIPAEDQARIFERFYRVDQARSRAKDGVGLGLGLAREIVHAHQGKLVLQESRPGRTCFTMTLPVLGN